MNVKFATRAEIHQRTGKERKIHTGSHPNGGLKHRCGIEIWAFTGLFA